MCVKSCASFSVNTRCRCYCFPRRTSLLHFLLPAFALLLLPATAASPAPTSSPTRTSIASFTTTLRLLLPPTSAILCFRFLLVSRFRFLFTGSFPTSDIHVAYQSPVSSIVGLPRRCSATDLATMTAIHRQSNALVPRFATLGRRPACMLSMFRVCEDVNPHLHSFHPPRHYPRPPPSPPPSPLPLPLPAATRRAWCDAFVTCLHWPQDRSPCAGHAQQLVLQAVDRKIFLVLEQLQEYCTSMLPFDPVLPSHTSFPGHTPLRP